MEGVQNAPIRVWEEMSVEVERDAVEEWSICACRYFGCPPAATISGA